jgi:Trk K+ transport system NAD-binding subunit
MTIREETGVNIIGYKVGDIFEINPHSETILEPGTTFLVLGNGDQLEKLEHYLKT